MNEDISANKEIHEFINENIHNERQDHSMSKMNQDISVNDYNY